MTFAGAIPWWGLLLLPVVWWLSLPQQPRRQVLTPHLAQWQAALAALRRRPPRWSWARWLLLAVAITAVVVAAGRPRLLGSPGAERLVVVLDGSASMAATGSLPTSAWERARTALQAQFASLPAVVDVTVLVASASPLRRHGATARSLQDLGVPGGSLGVDLAALATAAAAAPATAVWTLTDGQGQSVLPSVGALTVLPTRGPNACVLAVRLVDRWPLPELGVEAEVILHADAPAQVLLRVEGAVAMASERALPLVPGQVRTEAFAVQRLAAGGALRVVVQLPNDAARTDDVWSAELPPLPTPRLGVLVGGEDAGPFAAVAAAALAAEVGGTVVTAGAGSDVAFVLVDGGRVALPAGRARALVFGAATVGGGEPVLWPTPTVADWDRTGPLTGGLDLSELRVQQAWRAVLPAGVPFLWADDGDGRQPLAVVVGEGDVRSVHFAFRLQDSNLPLLPALPQLLRRAFVHCHGAGGEPQQLRAPLPVGEQDLAAAAVAADRPLPGFAGEGRDLTAWCLVAAMLALVLRNWLR